MIKVSYHMYEKYNFIYDSFIMLPLEVSRVRTNKMAIVHTGTAIKWSSRL